MSNEAKGRNIFTGTIMFFIGAVIGTVMHLLFDHIMNKYKIQTHVGLGLLGTGQIFIITLIIYWMDSTVMDMGLFVLGLLSAQDMVIRNLLVISKKHQKPTNKNEN